MITIAPEVFQTPKPTLDRGLYERFPEKVYVIKYGSADKYAAIENHQADKHGPLKSNALCVFHNEELAQVWYLQNPIPKLPDPEPKLVRFTGAIGIARSRLSPTISALAIYSDCSPFFEIFGI
mgnify:CR=1 FL=1